MFPYRQSCSFTTELKKRNYSSRCSLALWSYFLLYDDDHADKTSMFCFCCPKRDQQKLILFFTSRERRSFDGRFDARYVNWKGMSPTVHVAWFIAQAYLANLLYTAERDYAATVETCDTIFDTNKLSQQNRCFAQCRPTFPVVISTEWLEIFDSGIQAVIGFYSLCSFIESKAVRRSVYLGVCPVHFAHYLKLRCVVDRKNRGSLVQLEQEYSPHDERCKSDRRVCDTRVLLTVIKLFQILRNTSFTFGNSCRI